MNITLSADDIASLLAGKPLALITLTPPAPAVAQPPVVVQPPTPTKSGTVYKNGVFSWGGDYSWPSPGAVINYADKTLIPGSTVISVTCPTAEPGFQPYAPGYHFDTTGFTSLEFDLIPTVAGALYDSGFQTKGVDGTAGETPIGVLVNIMPFGPKTLTVGARNHFKVPLGAGGYNIPVGGTIYKFMIQSQTGETPSHWGVDNIAFT